ncbi:MAG: tryptophan--tRNA ligase [Actinomycetota bacterium]|nr:tryptophan--tRNA ligase [Actinomycetota bacterium]
MGGLSLNDNLKDASRRRVFSGIQPTGHVHLGNLLGALDSWVAQQERNEAYYCLVDLHAMTLPFDPKTLRRQVLAGGAVLLACGVDPDRSVLFVQSHVPAHSELAWILTCIARMGELRRMIQFKDRSKGDAAESVGAGLFAYPVLQAADVLLYQAHGVPVGEDQKQHVELMRDIGSRFNSQFGRTFVLPEAWIPAQGARIMALDDPTEKMSKSAPRPASKILLVDPPDTIRKKVRSAVTDSGRDIRATPDKPALTNLLTIFSLVEGIPVAELEERFSGTGYGDFKSALGDALVARIEPIQKRLEELLADPAETERLLVGGAQKAAGVAEETMTRVRDVTGLGPRP